MLLPLLPVDLQPDTRPPVLTITANLPGSPPETVEQEITAPLENAFSTLTELKSIYSVSNYGSSSIELTFDRRANMAQKKFEVSSIVRQMYPRLNPLVSFPTVAQRSRTSAQKNALLVYNINARLAPYRIRQVVEEALVTYIRQIKGVHNVVLSGAEKLRLVIAPDYAALSAYNLSTEQLRSLLTTEFGHSFPGAVYTAAGEKFTVQFSHHIRTVADLQNAMIKLGQGKLIPLKNLAHVYLEEDPPQQLFRINGKNSVSLSIYADDQVNRLTLAATVKKTIDNLSRQLPADFEVKLDIDDTEFLSREIRKNTYRSALSLGILVLFVLISYRNRTYLLILFSGILISLGITFLLAYLLGLSIHLYTIAGLTVSFGLLLDNSIVVMDQLYRSGSRKITLAVLGATLTTLLALLVVLFLPEKDRANLTEFCIIVCLALGSSVLTALFFTPAAFAYTYPGQTKGRKLTRNNLRKRVKALRIYDKVISLLRSRLKLVWVALILLFGLPVFMLPASWKGHEWYNLTIGNDWYQENIRPYVDKLTGGALRPFILNVYERGGYREPERSRLFIYAELPQGHTLSDMDQIMQATESFLSGVEGIDNFVTHIYSGQHALITITFTPEAERSMIPYQLKAKLISRSLDRGGVQWSIYGIGQGFSNALGEKLPSYRVEMTGYNFLELEKQAERLAAKLKEHPRVPLVNTNERLEWNEKPAEQWELHLRHRAVQAHHFKENEILSALQWMGERRTADFTVSLNNQFIPVYIIPKSNPQPDIYALLNTPVALPGKRFFVPKELAELRREKTASAIHKKDRQYIRIVGFEYFGNEKFGSQFLDETLEEMKNELPVGYEAKKLHWNWTWEKVKRQYSLLLILFAAVFVVCAVLFESLKQPLLIMGIIPFSFIGLFLTFAWGKLYFDQGGYAAFFLLGGLTVNAAIFVINDFNNQPCKNHNRAVLKAVTGKLRPILLTVLSTCLGLVPFLIGGQSEVFWFTLAAGTIGGLLFSVLLIVLILPVWMYKRPT